VDNDISAFSGRHRPEYARMMAAVKAGEVGAIVAWDPDRLHRSPVELEDFITAVEASAVEVATVQAGTLDLSSAAGRMTARVVGAVARHESEHKSERLRAKHVELAEAGKVSGGGHRPFGYEEDRVTVRESEAAVLVEVVGRVVRGHSLRSIVTWMAAEGVPSPLGTEWTTTSFRRVVTSPRIAGLRGHRGSIIGPAVWPAVVDPVQWEQARRVLLDPARSTWGPGRRYLLSGLAWCGVEGCGKKLVARPKADGRRCLVCASGVNFGGCGKIRQLVEPLDDLVVEAVVRHLDSSSVRDRLAHRVLPDTEAVTAKIRVLEGRLDELGRQWGSGEVDDVFAAGARRQILANLETLRAQLPQGDPGAEWVGRGVELAERWSSMHIDVRRSTVASVIERIVILPAVKGRNTFQPERVEIVWR